MPKSVSGTTILYNDSDISSNGYIMRATIASGTIPTTASLWELGARVTDLSTGTVYKNTGSVATPSFDAEDTISASEIADGAVTPVKSAQTEAVTATVDGLTTGIISATARHVTITSSVSTKIVTLPASVVGKTITGYESTNGFQLQTTASSNIKINNVDCDGTNSFNVPGNTFFKATCVGASDWVVELFTIAGNRGAVASCTATADGLTTGLILAGTKFVSATSAAATNALTLPAISASTVGQTIDIYVGANGYELLTPSTSNNTINTVDSDGTNQLDVAANSLLRCVQVSSTGWMCYQVDATTITVVAPDND